MNLIAFPILDDNLRESRKTTRIGQFGISIALPQPMKWSEAAHAGPGTRPQSAKQIFSGNFLAFFVANRAGRAYTHRITAFIVTRAGSIFWVPMIRFCWKPWVLAVALGGLLWLPAPVRATCGDYVVMEGESSGSHQVKKSPRSTETPCSQSRSRNSNDSSPSEPCRGPGCSGRGQTPVMPVSVSPQRTNPDQAYSLFDPPQTMLPGRQSLALRENQLVANPPPNSLFRPPRPI